MHRIRHIVAVLAALLLFAGMPVAAVAQSAGEDQYTDPLSPDAGGGSDSGGGSGGGGGSAGGESSGGGSGGGNAPAPAPQAAPAQASSDQLPRTGFPVVLPLVAGGALLAGGAVLRRRAS
jgi:LPXTG-motif cell wall-anchored protein